MFSLVKDGGKASLWHNLSLYLLKTSSSWILEIMPLTLINRVQLWNFNNINMGGQSEGIGVR